jgi:hypothetical protein
VPQAQKTTDKIIVPVYFNIIILYSKRKTDVSVLNMLPAYVPYHNKVYEILGMHK